VRAEDPGPVGTSTIDTIPIDWSVFWRTLRAVSEWTLEWYNGSSWVSRKSALDVIRDFPDPNHCKITLNFTSVEAGDYRLKFDVDQVVKSYVNEFTKWRCNLTYEGFTIVFDWSDLKDIPGLMLSSHVSEGQFHFKVQRNNVPANYNLELDPSIVATSTTSDATSESFQRKTGYDKGLFWVFYSDGSDLVYSTSPDGTTWTNRGGITAEDQQYGYRSSFWFGETYLHGTWASNLGISYRRGTLNADGSITWSAPEQTARITPGINFTIYLYVSIDSDGYPFICYLEGNPGDWIPYVTKSQWNNGSWSTQAGFPHKVGRYSGLMSRALIVPLTSLKMYVVWYRSGVGLNGTLWNGTGWETQVFLGDCSSFYSVVADGDTVHLAFLNGTTWALQYKAYTYGSGWGSEVTIDSGLSDSAPVLSIDVDTHVLYCFWTRNDTIFYNMRVTYWSSYTYNWTSDTNIIDRSITAFYQVSNRRLGFAYTQGSGSPYNVKFVYNPTHYVLFGPYNEGTGLRDYGGVNVTVYFAEDYFDTFVLNESVQVQYPHVPLYFHFAFANPRQYWLSSEEGIGTHLIFAFDDSTTVYTINFLDFAGALEENTYIEARYYVNGTRRIVEKRMVDEEAKVVMALVNGRMYHIIIKDGASYTFGDLLTTAITTIQLPLKAVDFPKETLMTQLYVNIYATRELGNPNGNITITYEDTLALTNAVDIFINFKNGTNVYNATETSDSFVHTWTSALNNTDYRLVVSIDHARYGVYPWRQYFPRAFSSAPWGMAWFGSLPFVTTVLLPSFLILCVAGCFSMINAHVGAFMAVLMAGFLTYIGWIPIPAGYLITAFCLAVFTALIKSKRRIRE